MQKRQNDKADSQVVTSIRRDVSNKGMSEIAEYCGLSASALYELSQTELPSFRRASSCKAGRTPNVSMIFLFHVLRYWNTCPLLYPRQEAQKASRVDRKFALKNTAVVLVVRSPVAEMSDEPHLLVPLSC